MRTYIVVDKSKPPFRKNIVAVAFAIVAFAIVTASILFVFVPNLESSSGKPTFLSILYMAMPSFVIGVFTAAIIAIVIIQRSGDPDKMLPWLAESPALMIIKIIIVAVSFYIFVSAITVSFDLESYGLLIDAILTILIAVFLTATFLLIGMWFSHKDSQKIHEHLDRIETRLSGTSNDPETSTDKSSKDDQKGVTK